jgi:ribosomal protein L37AE/L43A
MMVKLTEGDECPKCSSHQTRLDTTYGYWQCDRCQEVWGYAEDDPDYDEAMLPCDRCGSINTLMTAPFWYRCDDCGRTFRLDWVDGIEDG